MKMSESENEQNNKKKPSRRKYIIAAGFIVLLIIFALVFSLFQPEPEPDPASEALIKQYATNELYYLSGERKDIYELTDEDFAKITKLYLTSRSHSVVYDYIEISDIKLLEKFTNLESLSLGKITFPDKKIPEWAKKLSMLGIEYFENRYAINLNPLKKLHHINSFSFSGTAIKNFKPLSSISSLRHLSLSNTMISDLRPLKDLKNLETLNLNNTNISNIKPLKNLTNLNFIDLSYTNISGLEPLKNLIKLETLILDSTLISSIESLKNLKNLQKLSIINCPNITKEQIHGLQEIYPELEIISVKGGGFEGF